MAINKPKKNKNESNEEYIERATKELYPSGLHLSEIATKLNCPKLDVYNSVVAPTHRITTKSERAKMVSLREKGYSLRAIARETGRSATCVASRLRTEAIFREDYKEYNIPEKDLAKIAKYYKAGRSKAWIARKMNLTIYIIRYRLSKMGVPEDPNRNKVYTIPVTDARKIVKLHRAGAGINDIEYELGYNKATIKQYINNKK